MGYTNKEVELLRFTQIGSENKEDPDSPWEEAKILWRGQAVQFIRFIEIVYSSGTPEITLMVANRKNRGCDKDDPSFHAMMEDMSSRGIKIIGWRKNEAILDGDNTTETLKNLLEEVVYSKTNVYEDAVAIGPILKTGSVLDVALSKELRRKIISALTK